MSSAGRPISTTADIDVHHPTTQSALYKSGSGYGYGTVPGGLWTIHTEGGHVVDFVSQIWS